MNIDNKNEELDNTDKKLHISDVSESYSIKIDSVSNFRFELIKMIEQVRYNIGEYKDISSSQVAERFERKINSH
jgi:hypothetical protein